MIHLKKSSQFFYLKYIIDIVSLTDGRSRFLRVSVLIPLWLVKSLRKRLFQHLPPPPQGISNVSQAQILPLESQLNKFHHFPNTSSVRYFLEQINSFLLRTIFPAVKACNYPAWEPLGGLYHPQGSARVCQHEERARDGTAKTRVGTAAAWLLVPPRHYCWGGDNRNWTDTARTSDEITRPPRWLHGLGTFAVFRITQYIRRHENWNLIFSFVLSNRASTRRVPPGTKYRPLTISQLLVKTTRTCPVKKGRSNMEIRYISRLSTFFPSHNLVLYSQTEIFGQIKIWICKLVLGLKQQHYFLNH